MDYISTMGYRDTKTNVNARVAVKIDRGLTTMKHSEPQYVRITMRLCSVYHHSMVPGTVFFLFLVIILDLSFKGSLCVDVFELHEITPQQARGY